MRSELKRGLKERHVELIALGGSIGVGLFLGSATGIRLAGPSMIIAYLLGGGLIFLLLRALGEVAVAYPVAGSFSAHASVFWGPLLGYVTGWTYWFMWIITGIAEISAVGIYMNFWLPELPQWMPALATVLFIAAVNIITVEIYGEVEFWLSLIKVVTIIALIVLGMGLIFFGAGNGGTAVGLSNLWRHGGFFPHGFQGMALALPMALFAYTGAEVIGLTAGEAKNPEKVLPSAINKFLWRIVLFYAGSLYVLLAICPWTEIGGVSSPFVFVLEKTGVSYAAAFMNFVVLSAAVSSFNSGIFSTGRMLHSLAKEGAAPLFLARVNRFHSPVNAILVSSACLLLGVFLNYLIPAKIFLYITSLSTCAGLWIWGVIFFTQLKFRAGLTKREAANLLYPMPGYPFTGLAAILFLIGIIFCLGFNEDARPALAALPIWLILLAISYYICYNKKSKKRRD